MGPLAKDFYTIKDVAEMLDCSKDDVLHQFQIGTLAPSFYLEKVNCRVIPPETPEELWKDSAFKVWSGLAEAGICMDMVYKRVATGREWECDLKGMMLFSRHPEYFGTRLFPVESRIMTINDLLIAREEFERFKAACLNTGKTASTEINGESSESDENLALRLRNGGWPEKSIAQELKQRFPAINPSRIGRLITGITGVTVTTDAYRKRGNKLLK